MCSMEAATEDREVTPFEKNLEVWRQLWRVIERSDITIQIVDARNPIFYRCVFILMLIGKPNLIFLYIYVRSIDLERYVKEVGETKKTMLVINKSDYLTPEQRLVGNIRIK